MTSMRLGPLCLLSLVGLVTLGACNSDRKAFLVLDLTNQSGVTAFAKLDINVYLEGDTVPLAQSSIAHPQGNRFGIYFPVSGPTSITASVAGSDEEARVVAAGSSAVAFFRVAEIVVVPITLLPADGALGDAGVDDAAEGGSDPGTGGLSGTGGDPGTGGVSGSGGDPGIGGDSGTGGV